MSDAAFAKMDKRLTVSHELYGMESLMQYQGLADAAATGKNPVYRYLRTGKGDVEETLKFFTKLFGPFISLQENDSDTTYIFTDDASFMSAQVSQVKADIEPKRHMEIDFVSTNKTMFDKIKEMTKDFLQHNPSSNSVLALTNTPNGLALAALGEFNQELITDNYSADVVKGYKHVTTCLSSKDPCGRLVLFQGAPGTGKSYMIRSLVSSVDSTFIVVGSNMIADLSGPSILPILLGLSKQDGNPITFILEDADVALSDRKANGMTQLSGLLNLGDGLLGELLDIRIVATTNAGTLELDKAITRPGRLCQHVSFDVLSADDSNSLYSKLIGTPGTKKVRKPRTLAEVYRLARRDGWETPKTVNEPGTYI